MLVIAGVGPGNPKYLTREVEEYIREFKYILAFPRVKESLKELNKDIISIDTVSKIDDYISKDIDVLLLASGDPIFYGIVEYIKRKGIYIDKILPGISSFQYMMSKLGKSWHDAKLLSAHGRGHDLRQIKNNKTSIILTDKHNNPNYISKELEKLGIRGKIYSGYNLSYDDEIIFGNNIGDDIKIISPLAVVVIENEMD